MALEGKKRVKHNGADVEVTCKKLLGEGPGHSYRFTACLGTTTFHHTVTVGPTDGDVTVPTKEQLQKDMDAAREYAVKHAHFHHRVGLLEKELD